MGKVIETVSDSIAVEIIGQSVILIGKGNELHLFYKNIGENVIDTAVLPIKLRNKVHGIKKPINPSAKILLVYGEKEFVLLEYNEYYKFCEVHRAELSDWISCGSFINGNEEIVLLTAHSIILRFSYNFSTHECCVIERVSCSDKSTLYCAHLHGDKWNDLVVFAGNAFGELLIWQPRNNEENHLEHWKPKVSTLIHRIAAHNGVLFSIDYDVKSQYLVTTSDDRAMKWWKVIFANNTTNWSNSSFQALSSGYGHVARVFQGRIINDGPNVYALSVGEDSYFCLWNESGELIFKRRQQYGAIIWSFAYDYDTKTVYSIGSTGNLVAFGLNEILKGTDHSKNSTLLPMISDDNIGEYIAKIKYVNETLLIAVTNKNNLMSLKFNGEEWLKWKNETLKVGFKCTVLEVYQNIIAICGYKHLILLECKEYSEKFVILRDEEISKSVVRTFVFFNVQQYLICDDQGNCVLFINGVKRYLELPKCKEPWLTTALMLNQQNHILISTRQGNLLLYQLKQESSEYDLKYVIKHPHENLGATYLKCVQEKNIAAVIWSTGHDGALNEFSLDFLNNTIRACRRQIIPIAWIECLEKSYRDIDLFLGFNDNHFVIWCKDYDFLLHIPCGGGHRCWSYALNFKRDTISLAFIKNKRVNFYKMPLFNKELTTFPLAKRWHIASCNAMEILPPTSSSPHVVVSGGDDNLLKIHIFNKSTGLKEVKELHSHISNIRCLKILLLNENEFLLFSGGGRGQLCVTKVNFSSFRTLELLNYSLKTENYNNNIKSYNFDPETRLMSMDVKTLNKEDFAIYIGCSDGFVRLLKFNLRTFEIQLLSQYFYSKCILQIRFLSESDLILVAATDGLLKFFNSTLTECLYKLHHHDSGINGLSLFYDTFKKSLHILSGGDDQAVSYTELFFKNLSFQIVRQFYKPYLHSSQVSGCAISWNGKYGYTSGVDQVLNKIDLSNGDVVDSFYSCVADIKGVALIEKNLCLLYGCGFQIYAFKS